MGQPQQPHKARQLDGHRLGGLSCTCGAMAMGIARATLGKHKPSCGRIRNLTGDTVGGTTLPQVAAVAERYYDVEVALCVGSRVAKPTEAARRLEAGRGFVLQGNTRAIIGTRLQSSETARVNHAVWVNEGRGWGMVNGILRPEEAKVFDPLADGRRPAIDEMSSWWDWDVVLEFARKLRPWGDGDPRELGPGKMYSGFVRDTEPHAHYAHGGRPTTPFPDRTRASAPAGRRVNVREAPSTGSDIVDRLVPGELFVAFQRTTTGQTLEGSSVWFGDHDGKAWVHESGLRYKGGTT